MLRVHPWLAAVLLLVVAACSPKAGDASKMRSQRERDSVLGASRLPGAQGVRGALGASDSAAVRNARVDSIATQR